MTYVCQWASPFTTTYALDEFFPASPLQLQVEAETQRVSDIDKHQKAVLKNSSLGQSTTMNELLQTWHWLRTKKHADQCNAEIEQVEAQMQALEAQTKRLEMMQVLLEQDEEEEEEEEKVEGEKAVVEEDAVVEAEEQEAEEQQVEQQDQEGKGGASGDDDDDQEGEEDGQQEQNDQGGGDDTGGDGGDGEEEQENNQNAPPQPQEQNIFLAETVPNSSDLKGHTLTIRGVSDAAIVTAPTVNNKCNVFRALKNAGVYLKANRFAYNRQDYPHRYQNRLSSGKANPDM